MSNIPFEYKYNWTGASVTKINEEKRFPKKDIHEDLM